MSERSKSLQRPKVRFSQDSESADDPVKVPGPFHGPKIREIVTLKKPVILIRPQKEDDEPEIVEIRKKKFINIPTDSRTIESSRNRRISASAATVSKKPEKIIEQLQERKQNIPLPPEKPKAHQKVQEKLLPALPRVSPRTTLKSTTNLTKAKAEKKINEPQSRGRSLEQAGNKENIVRSLSSNKISEQSQKQIEKPDNIVQKPKTIVPNSSKTNVTKPVVSRIPEKPVRSARDIKKWSEPKIPVAGTMACMKTRNITAKTSRKTQVKKTLVRNSAGPPPKVYVGPGIIRTQTKSLSDCGEPDEIYQRPDVLSSDKLRRPEYNSIISTIKQLEEVKKKKNVKDIESLPPKYRSQAMAKISSVLDFAAGESIFKDLVDLSIDEDQLPMRLTRTKDPEPRQKDLVPKLSDFFVPQYSEEYAEVARIRPRTPDILDSWSAFKISDQINNWRNLLDET